MDQQKLKEFKNKLEEKKRAVIKQLESVGTRANGEEDNFNADFPDYGSSLEDNAIEVADYTTNLSLEKELEEELQSIERALNKIDDGTYGICSDCGQIIEPERLSIRPESTTCMACKKKRFGK